MVENEAILQEKIRLLGVMEMTFRRSANDRQVTFKDIAKETGLQEENVELLVNDLGFSSLIVILSHKPNHSPKYERQERLKTKRVIQ